MIAAYNSYCFGITDFRWLQALQDIVSIPGTVHVSTGKLAGLPYIRSSEGRSEKASLRGFLPVVLLKQKKARYLKFWIQAEKDLYYPCMENKG